MSREKAQTKIEEWFAGVTTPAFEAAVELKIAVGVAEGDYRFKDEPERLAGRGLLRADCQRPSRAGFHHLRGRVKGRPPT